MKRWIAALTAAAVLLAAGGVGFLAWLAVRDTGEQLPRISVYTKGQLVRVGPYVYRGTQFQNADRTMEVGELTVDTHNKVQLSVPEAVSQAPWRLLLVFEGGAVENIFRPGTRSAVTIPTVDTHAGKLQGLAVQLPTIVRMPDGELLETLHAEWSVETNWPGR